ncbi:CpaF pilus assembly protein, ATPase CpaF [Candidatus Magnetomorum sp. HK-1]|nr:CpaF pilus assembly protein, ATPase CpaF [Candidatus Magnetomorum sp. HK-1]
MSLQKRLGMITAGGQKDKQSNISDISQDKEEQERKCRIHYKVIDQMDLAVLSQSDDETLDQELDTAIRTIIQEEELNLSSDDNDSLVKEIKHEVLGLGPLEPLLSDESISEIMCNGYNNVFVERSGRLEKIPVRFRDNSHLLKIIDKIATNIGRRIDESSPMVDARLADGSRVNAIIPPLAIDGPSLTIRKFSKDPLQVSDLIRFGSISAQAARLMEGVVKAHLNVIISGGTGSGKTTMLNVFSSFIPQNERIVTIEDSAELQLQQEHVVRLETRPSNMEGHGEITIRDLVKNCLRMRPDRIVVGEVRSGEALDMMQAMSTGHDGSITTLHANSPRDCLSRLETLVAMGGLDISEKAIRRQIASAVHVIVQVARLSDGSRKVTSFSEVTGMEGNTITLQEIFKFEQTGVDQYGKVIGHFGPTGIRPACSKKLKAHGFELDGNMFNG